MIIYLSEKLTEFHSGCILSNMDTIQVLKKSGLSDKEATVYQAALELGTASVEAISKKAGTKRPTTYLVLDDLAKRGLVTLVPRAKKSLYAAESPERLIGDAERRAELLKRALPEMLAFYNTKKDKPTVQLYEGKQAVYEIYERILLAKDVAFFSTIRDVLAEYPDIPKRLNALAIAGKTRVREFLTRSTADIDYARTMKRNEFFQQRFAPRAGEFFTDNCLFDGNVAFFSIEPYIFAVLIKHHGIYQSLKSLYDYAWSAAIPFEQVAGKQIEKI